jgi:hypothetical protein
MADLLDPITWVNAQPRLPLFGLPPDDPGALGLLANARLAANKPWDYRQPGESSYFARFQPGYRPQQPGAPLTEGRPDDARGILSRIYEGAQGGAGGGELGIPRETIAKYPALEMLQIPARLAETVPRVFGATIGGLAGAGAGLAEHFGMSPANADRLQRDLNLGGTIGTMLMGAAPRPPAGAFGRMPMRSEPRPDTLPPTGGDIPPLAAAGMLEPPPATAASVARGEGPAGVVQAQPAIKPLELRYDPETVDSGRALQSDQTRVDVNARGLRDAFERTNQVQSQLSPRKIQKLREFVAQGNTLSLPEVSAYNGQIRFADGRHRAWLAAESDMPNLLIAVRRGNEGAINDLLEQARKARAREGGFQTDTLLAHGVAPTEPFTGFEPATGEVFAPTGRTATTTSAPGSPGVFAEVVRRGQAPIADQSAETAAANTGGNAQVFPLVHRSENPGRLELTGGETNHGIASALADAWARGHDSVLVKNYTLPGGISGDVLVVRDPAQLRSPFAQFDPAKRYSRDLLAGLAGTGILAGLYGGASNNGAQQ